MIRCNFPIIHPHISYLKTSKFPNFALYYVYLLITRSQRRVAIGMKRKASQKVGEDIIMKAIPATSLPTNLNTSGNTCKYCS